MRIVERWQAVGMNSADLSNRRIAAKFGVNNSVIRKLLVRHRQTETVEGRPRSGRPPKTTLREDRYFNYYNSQARLQPFSMAVQFRGMWPIGGRMSVRTVVLRLHNFRLCARRPVKRPEFIRRLHWNLRSCHLS